MCNDLKTWLDKEGYDETTTNAIIYKYYNGQFGGKTKQALQRAIVRELQQLGWSRRSNRGYLQDVWRRPQHAERNTDNS